MQAQLTETIRLLGEDRIFATEHIAKYRHLKKDLSIECAEEVDGVIEAFQVLNRRIQRALTQLNGEPMEIPHGRMT